ncbi:MAG: DUF1949 domain-containing protein [Propionibacterium sp.]|nr:DUF1949 domain-containing protein [Propionibacterium sp.]
MSERWPAAGQGAVAELEAKKSRFLAIVRRATTVEEARDLVAEARRFHPGARHYCSAHVISQPDAQPIWHSNDDGEPAQTAGRPMLDVLVGSGLSNVAAVVVRWFGGTLLGTGGLVRAYSEATKLALDALPTVRVELVDLWRLPVDHAHAGRVEAELRDAGITVHAVEYTATGALLTLADRDAEGLARTVASVTSGAADLAPAGRVLVEYSNT